MNKTDETLDYKRDIAPAFPKWKNLDFCAISRMGQKRRRRGFLPVLRMGDGAALYDQPNSGESFIR